MVEMDPIVAGGIPSYIKASKDQAVEGLLHFQQGPKAKRDRDAEQTADEKQMPCQEPGSIEREPER